MGECPGCKKSFQIVKSHLAKSSACSLAIHYQGLSQDDRKSFVPPAVWPSASVAHTSAPVSKPVKKTSSAHRPRTPSYPTSPHMPPPQANWHPPRKDQPSPALALLHQVLEKLDDPNRVYLEGDNAHIDNRETFKKLNTKVAAMEKTIKEQTKLIKQQKSAIEELNGAVSGMTAKLDKVAALLNVMSFTNPNSHQTAANVYDVDEEDVEEEEQEEEEEGMGDEMCSGYNDGF